MRRVEPRSGRPGGHCACAGSPAPSPSEPGRPPGGRPRTRREAVGERGITSPAAGAALRMRGAGGGPRPPREGPECCGLQCAPAHARWREAPRPPAVGSAAQARWRGTPGPGCWCCRWRRLCAGGGLGAARRERLSPGEVGRAAAVRGRVRSALRGGAGRAAAPGPAAAGGWWWCVCVGGGGCRGKAGDAAEGKPLKFDSGGGSPAARAAAAARGEGSGCPWAGRGRGRPPPGAGGARGAPARPGDPLCSCHNSRARLEPCPPGPPPARAAPAAPPPPPPGLRAGKGGRGTPRHPPAAGPGRAVAEPRRGPPPAPRRWGGQSRGRRLPPGRVRRRSPRWGGSSRRCRRGRPARPRRPTRGGAFPWRR